jgi:short subunit dehydrogenase-like uncharacterized protein
MDRRYDIVLLGATGYTGGLVAEQLAREQNGLRCALAGRDRQKLERVRERVLPNAEIVFADIEDVETIDALTQATRVLCSTVGPYAKYGSGVVEACARHGTDYCDITGEAYWIRRMVELHHDTAQESGARIVHACGFDSVPSDVGSLVVQHYALTRFGKPCERISAWFGETRGSFSGGGFATLLYSLEAYQRDPSLRVSHDARIRWDSRISSWTGPFVMAAVNTSIVHRSHALLGNDFSYEEARSFAGFLRAVGATLALAGFLGAAQVRALRRWIARFLPAPGDGPSASNRAKGHYTVRFVGEIDGEPKVSCHFSDRRDPGCDATTSMLSQAALALACDNLPKRGGVLTPAAALGVPFADRLRRQGTRIEVGDYP